MRIIVSKNPPRTVNNANTNGNTQTNNSNITSTDSLPQSSPTTTTTTTTTTTDNLHNPRFVSFNSSTSHHNNTFSNPPSTFQYTRSEYSPHHTTSYEAGNSPRRDPRQTRKPKKHKASPPETDDGYNSADEHGSSNRCYQASGVGSGPKFEEELKRKKGFSIKRVKEDGNCLFRSVADQIYGDEEMHNVTRAMCMDYMVKERDHFSQFVTEDFDEYIARKRRDKCFGNNVELQAFSELFGRPIEVYSGSAEAPMNIFHGSYSTDDPPMLLSYHGGNHYNSIIDPSNPSVGVGLGLPEYKPVGDRKFVAEAIKASEQEDLERGIVEESLRYSELAAVEQDIEEAILASSRVEYIASLFSNVRVPVTQDNSVNNSRANKRV